MSAREHHAFAPSALRRRTPASGSRRRRRSGTPRCRRESRRRATSRCDPCDALAVHEDAVRAEVAHHVARRRSAPPRRARARPRSARRRRRDPRRVRSRAPRPTPCTPCRPPARRVGRRSPAVARAAPARFARHRRRTSPRGSRTAWRRASMSSAKRSSCPAISTLSPCMSGVGSTERHAVHAHLRAAARRAE